MRYDYNFVKQFIEKDNMCELLDEKYKDTKSKLRCKCKLCNDVFERTFQRFKGGKYNCCQKCANKLANSQRLNLEDLKHQTLQMSNSILLQDEYVNNSTKMKFMCECGNIFYTSWTEFKNSCKRTCNKCSNTQKLTYGEVKEFIENNTSCRLISKDYNSVHQNIQIRCSCGNIFETTFRSFRDRYTRACRECRKLKSNLELQVENILNELNLKYKEQYTFENCVNKKKLPFDYYIEEFNLLIEVDGEQHYSQYRFEDNELKFADRIYNDAIKNSYCEDNNIPLLRIPYWDIKSAKSIIQMKIKELKY